MLSGCDSSSVSGGMIAARVPQKRAITLPSARTQTAVDLSDKAVDPFKGKSKAVVLVFISNDCPISNRYLPTLRLLKKKYASRGVRFWLVHADPTETVEAIRRHMIDFHIPSGVLRDPHHALVQRAKAKVTPESAVFAEGRLIYHGRIDDRFVAFGKARPAPTQNDLQDAIEAALAGKRPPRASTPVVGCYIAELE